MRRAAVRHLKWLEVESFRLTALAQQFPVMTTQVAHDGRLLIVNFLKVEFVNDSAKRFVGKHKTRLYLGHLFWSESRMIAGLCFIKREDRERADNLRLAIDAQ